MYKKVSLIAFVLLLFTSTTLFSQERESRKKIKALKVSFITEKLALTADEAAKFWPVYNKYEKERFDLFHGRRVALKKKIEELGGIDKLKESEAKDFASEMLAIEKGNYESNINYHKELSKIISYKKIVKLQMVEREFNSMLFRRYKNKKAKSRNKK